jgi:hypothetical protein
MQQFQQDSRNTRETGERSMNDIDGRILQSQNG